MRRVWVLITGLVLTTVLTTGEINSSAATTGDPYADEIMDYWDGGNGFVGGYGWSVMNIPVSPEVALGAPDDWYVSITPGEWITVKFLNNTIIDGPGPDLAIREIGNNNGQEKLDVWVSAVTDGVSFAYLGRIASDGPDGNPIIYLDLASINFSQPVGYVKLKDGIGGAVIGFDLDAIWALNSGEPMIQAAINIDPDTLNLKSKGIWITSYITFNNTFNAIAIDIGTVLLEETIPAVWGDVQNDALMVKFDRSEVEDMLCPGTYNLKVSGELIDGTLFEGYSDEISVIEPT